MPFLLIAALMIAAIASPSAAAEAAPPRQLSGNAGADAQPIAPAGGLKALRTPAAGQSTSTHQPTRHAQVLPAAASSAPAAVDEESVTSQPPASDASIPLTRRTRDTTTALGRDGALSAADEQRAQGRSTWIATTIGGLGIALGVFLLLAWMVRRSVPAGLRPLPSDAVEVLGRAPLVGRQQLHVLRFANKLVLISTTPTGDTISLAEIEDTDEVNRIVALCRQHDSQSSSESFRRLLHQFGQEPAEPGFVDAAPSRLMPSHSRPIDQKG